MYEQKPVLYLFNVFSTKVSKTYRFVLTTLSTYFFQNKKKKKRKQYQFEVMTYENGGSIPTEVRNAL